MIKRAPAVLAAFLLALGTAGHAYESDDIEPAGVSGSQIVVGLAGSGVTHGWIAVRDSNGTSFPPAGWFQLPWQTYVQRNGGLHAATGDVDGDGMDEVVLGLDWPGNGWIAVFDDAAHSHAFLQWIQLTWPDYNAGNGQVWPAVGDLDGDGRAEIVAGLGFGGLGWFEVFDDAANGYQHLLWKRVNWPDYVATLNGATHPAVGDVDGDGVGEIVLGLSTGSNGWIEVVGGASDGWSHISWVQVDWPQYSSDSGTTYPAAGDLDGDGDAEIIAGLGAGGGGWLEIFSATNRVYSHTNWIRTSWAEFNQYGTGETHPAVGNLDADPPAEIVVGLDRYYDPVSGSGNNGWLDVRDDALTGYIDLGWFNLDWESFRTHGWGTFPAIARL